MHYKAILFDIDGTLVDSNNQHVEAWMSAFTDIGRHFSHAAVHAQIGKGADMLVPALLPDADEGQQEKLAKAHDDAFKSRYLGNVVAFPDARNLLLHVSQNGQKVVLASSASEEDLNHYLNLLDIRELVTAATSGDDVKNTKPAPDVFASAIEKVPGVKRDEAIIVGDTPYDVEAGLACGIKTIALRSGGFSDRALHKAGAIGIYDDVATLLAGYDMSPLGKV